MIVPVMPRPLRWVIESFALALAIVFVTPLVSAQITELRDHNGQPIACTRSGLRGFSSQCGTGGGYDTIFLGSVLSVVEMAGMEKRLRLMPEESFLGDPGKELTVITSQGACFPDIKAGDEWLFYLQHDPDKPKRLLLAYGSPSGPAADSQNEIARLRRLAQMAGTGIIKGSVTQRVFEDDVETSIDVPDRRIVAKRKQNGREYRATTGADGHYEFEPLPYGSYELTANTAPGLWAEEGDVEVESRNCADVDFEMRPDGEISGHIRNADGTPAAYASLAVIPSLGNGARFFPTADDQGYFEVKGLAPGGYLVGLGIDDDSEEPKTQPPVYYPGTQDRDLAVVVEIGPSGKRTDIDFKLPILFASRP